MLSDRTEFPVELALSGALGAQPPSSLGYLRDITRRRRADDPARAPAGARADRAARTPTRHGTSFEAILRGVADAVTAQAPDGRLLFANDAAVQTLGFESSGGAAWPRRPPRRSWTRFELLDEHGEPFPPEALPGRRALGGEEGAEAVVRFRVRATGEERWAASRPRPSATPTAT